MQDVMNKKILLVEDEAIIAMSSKRQLEQYGYTVIHASTGEKAVTSIKTTAEIDLILMDINLGSGIDGTEAAEIILKDYDIPIVFVSSHTEPEVVEKTEKITSYGYVVKSSSITVLDASIKMAFKLFEEKKKSKSTNDRLEATFNALPDLLFEVGLDGYYYGAHTSKNELLYMPLQDLIGKYIPDILPPEISDIIIASIGEAHDNGFSKGRKYKLNVPAGIRWFETTVSRIEGFPERPHFILLCRDITEQRQLQEALEKRIALLTLPLENTASISFADLFSISDIQQLQDDFSNATGVASIITQTDGTPITAPSNFCSLCKDIIRKTKLGNANCLKSDAALGRMNSREPCIQPCFSSGLWDAGAGISVGGKHIANWLIGQVRDENQSEEKMLEYAKKIGADENAFIEAFREVPAMGKEKFNHIAAALYRLANQLSTLAYQNVQQARMLSERKLVEIALQEKSEEYEVINEELRSTTEELQAQNEELTQSKELLSLSEARLLQAEKVAKIGNWTLRLDTGIMIASSGAEAIYGVDIKKTSLADVLLIPLPEYRPFLEKALSDLVAQNIGYDLEFKIRRPEDGSVVDIHSLATYDNRTNTVFGVIQDITEQKRNETVLQENQEKLRFALEASGPGEWEFEI